MVKKVNVCVSWTNGDECKARFLKNKELDKINFVLRHLQKPVSLSLSKVEMSEIEVSSGFDKLSLTNSSFE